MEKTIHKVRLEHMLMPAYFKDFKCIAEACQDSCCKNWNIQFGKKDYLKIKRAEKSPELQDKVDKGMRRLRDNAVNEERYAEFRMGSGVCGLLNDDGLCDLQIECGYGCLPKVCKEFPRAHRQSLGEIHQSLTLGCEAVLHQLFNLPDGVEFILETLPPDQQKQMNLAIASPLQPQFTEIMSVCIDILQTRTYSMSQRMVLLGFALKDLLPLFDEENPDPARWLARVNALLQAPETTGALAEVPGDRHVFVLNNIKMLARIWGDSRNSIQDLRRALDNLGIQIKYEIGQGGIRLHYEGETYLDDYNRAVQAFSENFGDIEYFFENIMVSVLFHLGYPQLSSADDLWKSYVNLCNVYSFLQFAVIAGCAKDATREMLFHQVVSVMRALLHNTKRQSQLRDEFFENDSSTLAHMAILVLG